MPLRQATIWKVVVGTIQLGSSQFCTSFLFPMDVCSRGVPVCLDFFFWPNGRWKCDEPKRKLQNQWKEKGRQHRTRCVFSTCVWIWCRDQFVGQLQCWLAGLSITGSPREEYESTRHRLKRRAQRRQTPLVDSSSFPLIESTFYRSTGLGFLLFPLLFYFFFRLVFFLCLLFLTSR